MPDIILEAETGRTRGSSSSRRLRHDGKIPGVVYGHNVEVTAVSVDARALRAALSTAAGNNAVIDLQVGGDHHLAMAKDIQLHPVRGTVAHVDFLVVNRDEVVTVDVPLVLTGEAKGVSSEGGVLSHELFSLTIHAKPGRIPTSIEVDITALTIGDAVRVGDINLPDGVSCDVDPDSVVVIAQGAQAEAPAEGEAAAEEGAGDAAADGAAGGGQGAGGQGAGEG